MNTKILGVKRALHDILDCEPECPEYAVNLDALGHLLEHYLGATVYDMYVVVDVKDEGKWRLPVEVTP